jgi:hypothetical protein
MKEGDMADTQEIRRQLDGWLDELDIKATGLAREILTLKIAILLEQHGQAVLDRLGETQATRPAP